MSRDVVLYVQDMIQACERMQEYTRRAPDGTSPRDGKTLDAVVRNMEILGEAAKNVPEAIRVQAIGIPWRSVCGMRDILAHDYFGVDEPRVWLVTENEIAPLLAALRELLVKISRSE